MNDLLNQPTVDTSNLTPIEIALGIDEEGMTTAKKLYEFLELAKGQFSRWSKINILENAFAEEGRDYWGFDINVEGNQTRDYRLTSNFAKKLSMIQKNQKGEDARKYFTEVEDGAKKMVLQYQEMSPQLQYMINVEREQKRQAKEISKVREMAQANATRVDSIREVVALDTTSWREDTPRLPLMSSPQQPGIKLREG